jgi:hypothetical protein
VIVLCASWRVLAGVNQNVIEDGIAKKIFLAPDVLNIQIALNSIIGTINWLLYDLLDENFSN